MPSAGILLRGSFLRSTTLASRARAHLHACNADIREEDANETSPLATIAPSLANYGHDRFRHRIGCTDCFRCRRNQGVDNPCDEPRVNRTWGAFQRTSEHKIALILAPPAEIRRRIVNGEIVDVAISGSGIIEDLVQQGKIARDSALTLYSVGYVRGGSRGIGEAGHRLCRSLQARALGRQIDRLYRSSGRRSERHPFREGSRSPGCREKD